MKNRVLLLATFLSLFLSSCVEEIDSDAFTGQSTNRLVVEGSITTERKAHAVKLSRTRPAIPTGDSPGISGATVSIFDGTTLFPLKEIDTIPGSYLTDSTVAAEMGKTYTLRIELAGEIYTASTTIEPARPFETAANLFTPPNRLANPIAGNLTVFDLEFPKVRYGAAAPSREFFYAQEPIGHQPVSAYYYQFPGIDPEGFLLNFSGSNQSLLVEAGTVITQYRYSLTQSYYQFIRNLYAETQFRGGIFDRVPATVQGNISNGAFGFFSGSQVIARSFIVQKSWLGQ